MWHNEDRSCSILGFTLFDVDKLGTEKPHAERSTEGTAYPTAARYVCATDQPGAESAH